MNKEKFKVSEASRHSRKAVTGSWVHDKYSFLEREWDLPSGPTQASQADDWVLGGTYRERLRKSSFVSQTYT